MERWESDELLDLLLAPRVSSRILTFLRYQVVKAEAFGLQSGEEKTVVAVKMVKLAADISYLKALMAELKIMVHLGRYLEKCGKFSYPCYIFKGTSTLSTFWELARPT